MRPELSQLPTAQDLSEQILHHLTHTQGRGPEFATVFDWRLAVSYTIRDLIVTPWMAGHRASRDRKLKRVYYLSMEFLIGRILGDAIINLGLDAQMDQALATLGLDRTEILEDEPDAALGNGGLGRLAACFMESLSSLGVPAFGYGIRYEHGLFRQRFEGGQQVEAPGLAEPAPSMGIRPGRLQLHGRLQRPCRDRRRQKRLEAR